MEFDAIAGLLKTRWPEVEAPKVEVGESFVMVPVKDCHAILKFLKEETSLYFDSLMCLSGADTGRELWVVYSLHSLTHRHRFSVKLVLGRETPACDTVCDLWAMANFFEREAFDLYGIQFKGHPDLRRIMNPPDWVGWPGRKDYMYPEEYHGYPTLREDQFFADAVGAGNEDREEQDKALLEKLGLVEKK